MDKLFEIALQKACDNGGLATWFIIFWLAVVLAVYALKKNGLITFGSQPGRRRCDKYCDDHKTLRANMDAHKDDLAEIEAGATGNFERLERLILNIDSKLDQRFEDVYALLRTYSDNLSAHVGYCRGIQESKAAKR